MESDDWQQVRAILRAERQHDLRVLTGADWAVIPKEEMLRFDSKSFAALKGRSGSPFPNAFGSSPPDDAQPVDGVPRTKATSGWGMWRIEQAVTSALPTRQGGTNTVYRNNAIEITYRLMATACDVNLGEANGPCSTAAVEAYVYKVLARQSPGSRSYVLTPKEIRLLGELFRKHGTWLRQQLHLSKRRYEQLLNGKMEELARGLASEGSKALLLAVGRGNGDRRRRGGGGAHGRPGQLG